MKVYVVQRKVLNWTWDWENYSVHLTLEGAKKACKEIIKNVANNEDEMNDCLAQLEYESYVNDICAIEAWKVEE